MISFEFIEDTFSRRNSNQYELSILLGVDSLCYLVADAAAKVQVVKRHSYEASYLPANFAARLDQLMREDRMLQFSFRNIKLAVFNEHSTLIPNRLYNPEEKRTYLEKVVQLAPNQVIEVDELALANAHHLYALPSEMSKALRRYFSGARIFHSATPLYLATQKKAAQLVSKSVFINLLGRVMQVFVYDREELLFYNSFPFATPKDFVYYTLLVFDQFNLHQEESPVFLTGEILENSELHHQLYRYVAQLQLLSKIDWYEFGARGKQEEMHRFYDLCALKWC